jgi:hypothetical protein
MAVRILDLLHAFAQDYQIHLCKSCVHLWLKILASAMRARGLSTQTLFPLGNPGV